MYLTMQSNCTWALCQGLGLVINLPTIGTSVHGGLCVCVCTPEIAALFGCVLSLEEMDFD